VDFERRSAIKSQVLTDFVVDWTSPTQNIDEEIPTPWIVQCDGAWCHKGVGTSAVVTSPAGVVIRYAVRLIFVNKEHSTNNTTEYEALLLALRKLKALGQQTFIIRTDSKIIQEHIEKKRSKESRFDEVPGKVQRNGKTLQRLLSTAYSKR
jgi:ribonuclease HI